MSETWMGRSCKAALDLCKMVENRMWGSMMPLEQFKGVPSEAIRKAEGKQFVPNTSPCMNFWS
ncbi:uncharacterized protein EV420DRAFT_1546631 [Desarmillaria tabescens]|uniref:Uncharacterized protein n=1 Tax=Armillaria tabescens TaxID=1929756 RepID=A0AA39KBN4_ARMTA|nr:uncharacterized protein EV420DRAFT_1546631 [Desarmillaria tabescens]KAK0458125.1 hypothetical protein EV420DRAFT_1546631 [Desarmillaria tabescens]